jgi:hypothetical protein
MCFGSLEDVIMATFPNEESLEDHFTLPAFSRQNVQNAIGTLYHLSDLDWAMEMARPSFYEVKNFSIRTPENIKGRDVSWLRVDLVLRRHTGMVEVGWRVFFYLLKYQKLMPGEWIEWIDQRKFLLFPYAVCQGKDNQGEDVDCCPALFRNSEGAINAVIANRQPTIAMRTPIAVYFS